MDWGVGSISELGAIRYINDEDVKTPTRMKSRTILVGKMAGAAFLTIQCVGGWGAG